jgi:hypothetical protein
LQIYEDGLVGILVQIHDELDKAVADAYGWPANLSDEEILYRLVDLNRARAREESRGIIRWLRPEFQNPGGTARQEAGETEALDLEEAEPLASTARAKWPKKLPEQMQAVRSAVAALAGPATPEAVARRFEKARRDKVAEIMEGLAAVGQLRQVGADQFAA